MFAYSYSSFSLKHLKSCCGAISLFFAVFFLFGPLANAPAFAVEEREAPQERGDEGDEGLEKEFPFLENTGQEQAIINEFLGEKEAKHVLRTTFISFYGGGGIIDGGDYNAFASYNNSNITRTDGGENLLGELGNSQEFGMRFGVMTGRRSSVNLGFTYWLKNGSSQVGDFVMGVQPLGTQNNFELNSEVTVYGASVGGEYFLAGAPSRTGIVRGLSASVIGDVGLYGASWSVWKGTGNINLSTGMFEQIGDAYTGQSVGATAGLQLGYPTGILNSVASVTLGYTYLKFDNLAWENSSGDKIFPTYSSNTADRVELDFSGLRGRFELRKYLSW